jgi:hypothetical protein
VARIDKYEPLSGGFRAQLSIDWPSADLNKIVPVSLNTSGKVVKGTAGQSGFIGVVCLNGYQAAPFNNWTGLRYAGDVVDVMQDGEIVELTGLIAGQRYFAAADGNSLVPASGTITALQMVGWTVEATRMIVRVQSGKNIT